MIVYGLTMQEKPEQVPKEVATWLLERNSRYPNVDFTVECRDPHPSQVEEFVSMARKWSRVFSYSPPDYGIGAVSFLYLMQCWNVRIIGGLDEEGNIADRSKVEDIQPFSRELRAEIAGLPPDFERVGEGMIGIPRQDDDAPLEKPTEMISLPPDLRWTSDVSMSGEEFNKLLNDPQTKTEAERAIWEKDWEALKRLKEQSG
jgi:hypothetical protein